MTRQLGDGLLGAGWSLDEDVGVTKARRRFAWLAVGLTAVLLVALTLLALYLAPAVIIALS